DYEVLAWMGMVRGYQGFGLGEHSHSIWDFVKFESCFLYPADEGDDDNDDDDDEDDDEEKEHLALVISLMYLLWNLCPQARISVRLEPLMAAPMKACIAEYAVALTPHTAHTISLLHYHLHSPRFPHHPSHYHHHLLLVLPMLRHCWATMQL
ncbi:hypothetical protein Tco_0647566, partial [Tanacetum coccineum]